MNDPLRVGEPVRRFMADAMLGRLARWLRILGYDTAYEKVIDDDDLIKRAIGEDRWLLTRDGYLAQRKVLRGRHTLIKRDDLNGQLWQLHHELSVRLDLDDERSFRCADCNTTLRTIPEENAAACVPPFVAQRYHDFLRCDSCGRVCWPGTHWESMRNRLALIRSGETNAER